RKPLLLQLPLRVGPTKNVSLCLPVRQTGVPASVAQPSSLSVLALVVRA
ncbi:unnamed protein product, partial [Brassica oleracea]